MMKKITLQIITLYISYTWCFAQGGYSSASVSSSNYNIPKPDDIVIEEFMNYHKHNIKEPVNGEKLAIDLRWGNSILDKKNEEALLQIGISTIKSEHISRNAPPINICLVVDKSGSMSSYLMKVKGALKIFIKKLRPIDIISIVLFDEIAEVLVEPQQVIDINNLNEKIESIQANSSTDINNGLILGYKELLKNYSENKTNRIVLLTDGLANTGVIDASLISSDPQKQNIAKNINLWAIGLGIKYDSEMLRTLVRSTGGQIHFIDNNDDISKVFNEEVESLLWPIGTKAEVSIEYDEKVLENIEFLGYDPKYSNNKILLSIENINAGLTQVMLTKFRYRDREQKTNIVVKLSYYDLIQKRTIMIENNIPIVYETTDNPENLFKDIEVKQNYYIGYLAKSLKEMAIAHANGDDKKAYEILEISIHKVEQAFDITKEPNIQLVLNIAKEYKQFLKK